jgi:hypothetical protein
VGQSLTWTARSFLPGHTSILRIPRNTYADPSMSAAIDGAFNTPEISIRSSTATCSTGNCTWPLYPTLGVCHDCEDVSHLLEYFCKNHTSLDIAAIPRGALDPCGFRVNNTFVVGLDGDLGFRQATSLSTVFVDTFNASLTFGGPFWNTTIFSNYTLPIADFYIGYIPGGPPAVLRNETPVLVECLLSWCAKTLEARFENGSLEESVVGTITIQPDTMDETGSSPVVAVLGSNTTFTIANQTTQNLRDWILSNLPPVLSQDPNFPFVSDVGMWQFHQVPPYDLDGYLSNLTTAITNNMKSRVAGTVPIEGTAWKSERFVQVRWEWITLPAVSLLGSLILICATVLKGRKTNAPVWKTSTLAILLHGLSEDTQRIIDSDISSSQTEAVSTQLRVRLSSGRGNTRLVAADEYVVSQRQA